MSLPSPYGDGAKTQGHALYNRPLDAHARRRKAGASQEESKIFIYFILKSLNLFIEEILFPVFAGAFLDFVSDTDINLLTKSKFSTNKAQ